MADENKQVDKEALKAQKQAEKEALKAKKERIKQSKPKKEGNVFTRMFKAIKKFFKDYKSEMKKVVWYGRKQTIKSTGVVIVVLVATSAAIGLLDLGLNKLLMWIGSLI